MNSTLRFAEFRQFLVDLGFEEAVVKEQYLRFRHPPSGTEFLFRAYRDNDPVSARDLYAVRSHLDWRGVMERAEFDRFLAKAPA